MDSKKNMLLLLGGTYHDFDGFAQTMSPLFGRYGYQVRPTYDSATLLQLEDSDVDVVVLYTCMGGTDAQGQPVPSLSVAETTALCAYVEQGGGVVAAHAATVSAKENGALRSLLGAAFISHPPQFAFTVYPLASAHPVTEGIDAFSVFDEFYIQAYEADISIQMAAMERGVCYPMVWTRHQGAGRVCNVAPGHSARVWTLPTYQQLFIQAADWVCHLRPPATSERRNA